MARYGKGVFIYTATPGFRQLPAGVPGAFRIFANLIAGGERPGGPDPWKKLRTITAGPPLVSTWRRLYVLVLFNLALQIFSVLPVHEGVSMVIRHTACRILLLSSAITFMISPRSGNSYNGDFRDPAAFERTGGACSVAGPFLAGELAAILTRRIRAMERARDSRPNRKNRPGPRRRRGHRPAGRALFRAALHESIKP